MSPQEQFGHRAVSGAFYTGMSQAVRVLLSVGSTIIVARLLVPSDFGVLAMASPVMGFLLIFQDLGLNQAVIQRETISDQQLTALFWINVLGSAAIALVMLSISPLVGYFYHDARAAKLTAAFSANVLLGGIVLQHAALLNRRMLFAKSGLIEIVTAVAGFLATTISAMILRSYWSLWLGYFASTLVNVVCLWVAVGWRPQRKVTFAGTRELIGFGANVTVFNTVNFLSRNLDNLLIARFWGAAQLGLYDRAYKLMTFPLQSINQPLARVMVPVLSRLQNEPERYRNSFLMAVRVMLIVSMPGIAVAASMSERLVNFLLGERWAEAGPIFFWLSLCAVTSALSNATGWLFISCGHTRAFARWGLFSSALTITSFAIGLPWGAVGVARAYAVCMTLIVPPLLYLWAPRGTPVSTRDLYRVLLEPFAAGAVTAVVVRLLMPHFATPELLALSLAFSYATAIVFQAATRDGRFALVRMRDLTKGVAQAWLNKRMKPSRNAAT